MKHKQSGFSLLELLIAVAIVGVLAKIAYPSYQDSIIQSKRKEIEAALVTCANAMEMWKMQHTNSYLGAGPSGADTGVPAICNTTQYYTLTISSATAATYVLQAAPLAPFADANCGTLTISNVGVKTPTTSGCW